LLGGDARSQPPVLQAQRRFNPRLPLLGGDATELTGIVDRLEVSIHASRCWEAMLFLINAFDDE